MRSKCYALSSGSIWLSSPLLSGPYSASALFKPSEAREKSGGHHFHFTNLHPRNGSLTNKSSTNSLSNPRLNNQSTHSTCEQTPTCPPLLSVLSLMIHYVPMLDQTLIPFPKEREERQHLHQILCPKSSSCPMAKVQATVSLFLDSHRRILTKNISCNNFTSIAEGDRLDVRSQDPLFFVHFPF